MTLREVRETLLEIVRNNNNKLDSKLNEVVDLQNSYASTVKGPHAMGEETTAQQGTNQTRTNDFRALVRAAQNTELAEGCERKLRSCNLMLHRVLESDSDDVNERKQLDEVYIVKCFQDVQVAFTYNL